MLHLLYCFSADCYRHDIFCFVLKQTAPVGQMYPQNANYFMPGGAQRFYPPTGMPPVRPNPRWGQPQMRGAGQQQGGMFIHDPSEL